MRVFVFPGQGAQQRGMGKDLFDAWPTQTHAASEILGYSIKSLCTEDPARELNKTQFSQPALFVVGALSYLRRRDELGRDPDAAAGHSLGEYNALFAAGAFDFEVGVQLVKRRGELMARAQGGAMAAVLNLEADRVRALLEEHGLDSLDIANLNTPTQTVLSGPEVDITRAGPIFQEAGGRYARLNTSAAFHSRYMEAAAQEFRAYLAGFSFRPLRFPVIANVTARPYAPGDTVNMLAAQLRSPVRWGEIVAYLLNEGEVEFEDLGHGTVLTKIITENRRTFTPRSREGETRVPVEPATPATPAMPAASSGIEDPAPRGASGNGSAHDTKGHRAAVKSNGNGAHTLSPELLAEALRSSEVAESGHAQASSRRSPSAAPGQRLGSPEFRRAYGTEYAYYAGPMREGISGVAMIEKLARAGILGVFGAAGLSEQELDRSLSTLQRRLEGRSLAVDLRAGEDEQGRVRALLQHGVTIVEASGFSLVTPALAHYRVKGVHRGFDGVVRAPHQIIGRTSRLEVAERLLAPPPARVLRELVAGGQLSAQEAELASELTTVTDLCVVAEAGSATEHGSALTLLPAFLRLRAEQPAAAAVRIGLAGGIGAPESAAAAFLMGADFICTTSINQCTVEAATSGLAKDLLEKAQIHDTAYIPDSAHFEVGGRAQVLKKGVFFPARANKLYELYRSHPSLDALDAESRRLLEEKYFGKRLDDVHAELTAMSPASAQEAEGNPKARMARVFRAYLDRAHTYARSGDAAQRVQFHIPCSSAMGAFNAWVKGTPLEPWPNRHVDEIAVHLMNGAAEFLARQGRSLAAIVG
ncbi:ACP S-malonyltransferase [Chondromyces apiculatus]|uniref:[acyl-carrier-protein] S-malonyltransferase n=1 Tax=Chondromyces apiculatus DSM 436 TaxID=1192034 RepID=A0A017T709_9BACT|nr:ACP S-malonyltransferase [Chondromyces apiculatus]EYF04555.1 acyltransferase/malonyl CoA-acyl carrier protein transacylase [Chondromyces apiculatus DSM 436]